MSRDLDKPTLNIPLAASYNERGIAGFTNTITNGLDQRKINSIYEPVQNALSGNTTLYLSKRPGVSSTALSYGVSSQTAHLWETKPSPSASLAETDFVVFSTLNNDVRASDTVTTITVTTLASYKPAYIDKTLISAVETMVLEIRNSSMAQKIYYASDITTWTLVTSATITSLTLHGKGEHLDGYMFKMDSTNKVYSTDLNTLDVWSANSYITKQAVQDVPRGLGRLGRQIIAWGADTMEVASNAGNATGSPLEWAPALFKRTGMSPVSVIDVRHYYAQVRDRIYWRGTNPDGVYTYNGETVEKVSSPSVEKILLEMTTYGVFTLDVLGRSAVAFSFDVPGASPQRALLFFPDWKDWFEWTSTVFAPISCSRVNNVLTAINTSSNKLMLMRVTNGDIWQDNGVSFAWTHQFKLPNTGNRHQSMKMFGLKGDTARSALNVSVEFSDDDYQSFATARTIDMTQVAKKHIYRCGSYSDRAVRLTYTGALQLRLEAALARIE